MTVKELIEALQQCHPDAQVFFSVDFESEECSPIAVEHEVMWRREKGDTQHPGKVYLHNNKSHFFEADGTPTKRNFILT